jgi:hypothetical protein
MKESFKKGRTHVIYQDAAMLRIAYFMIIVSGESVILNAL